MSATGQNAKYSPRVNVFRCSPNSRHSAEQPCRLQTSRPNQPAETVPLLPRWPLTPASPMLTELSRSSDRGCFAPAAAQRSQPHFFEQLANRHDASAKSSVLIVYVLAEL